jgi:hypothetical protein
VVVSGFQTAVVKEFYTYVVSDPNFSCQVSGSFAAVYQVPRLLFDDVQLLESYVMKSSDPAIRRWWAQYMESTGRIGKWWVLNMESSGRTRRW